MNTAQIEKNITELKKHLSKKDFICDFLRAYGISKSTLTLLKRGKRNLSKRKDQLILKKKVFFQETSKDSPVTIFESLMNEESTYRYDPRFLIVTDYEQLLAYDTKTKELLDIQLNDIDKSFGFFLPLAGMEKIKYQNEHDADIKAAEQMAKLYDQILKENKFNTVHRKHELNLFFSRLLFCFFAEDTGIFEQSSFTNSISYYTNTNGSDLRDYFQSLFEVLDTRDKNLAVLPVYLKSFPYVNGGLFREKIQPPNFSRKSRRMIIHAGTLDWANINPDIFGSMIQAVVHDTGDRASLGIHYTSVSNIMKVIGPLFLDEFREELEINIDNIMKLNHLLSKLRQTVFFDPACGSGNFLVIAYKEIRQLEIDVFKRIQKISPQMSFPFSLISLSQFYGIEIDSFACEIAALSLWLAEHQMNIKFKDTFGSSQPSLPLKKGGNIVCENATRISWEEICPKKDNQPIYVFGNPPYLGSSRQNDKQKGDMSYVFHDVKGYKNLDYIACWFYKGGQYIKSVGAEIGFVTTNSICQGEQVALLWPRLFLLGNEISFAHPSFKWSNNAKYNAGVICSIVGLRRLDNRPKYLFHLDTKCQVKNISPYLTGNKNLVIYKRNTPLSNLTAMTYGNKAADGGNLILSLSERDELLEKDIRIKQFIKPLIGSNEFIKGIKRYAIWIEDNELEKARVIPEIVKRIEKVKKFRLSSKKQATRNDADFAHRFSEVRQPNTDSIIIPRVSSERREYIPFGFVDKKTVVLDSAQAIYNPEPYVFGIISSKMHMVWVRATSGRLENRIRYSSALSYNTFPLPELSEQQKNTIQNHVFNILDEREYYSEKTKAELYDPDKMPDSLREAHQNLDKAVELCYRATPFKGDEERLEHLLKLYEKLTLSENK